MRDLRFVILPLLAAALAPMTGRADGGNGRWRVFRMEDGLAERSVLALTLSVRGNLWARHNEQKISWFDGYQIRAVPGAGSSTAPIYESRSGQLWTISAEGVMDFRRDQWVLHAVPELRAEVQTNPTRVLRPVPLLPGSRDRILILLPDVLLDYDAGDNKTQVIRRAATTGLGRFNDLVESRDGGIWLAGQLGLAKLPGPVRRLTPDVEWTEHRPDPAWRVRNLERLLEDEEGGVTMTGDQDEGSPRVLLHFDGRNWGSLIPLPERVRHAWRAAGDAFWACSRSALYRHSGAGWEVVLIPGVNPNILQIHDVVVENAGAFWLATSEGLVRYAPGLWQASVSAGTDATPIRAIVEGSSGDLYLVTTNQLRRIHERVAADFPLPGELTTGSREQGLDAWSLADGSLVIGIRGQFQRFQPQTGQWSLLAPADGGSVHGIAGRSDDGRLFAEVIDPAGKVRVDRLDAAGFSPFLSPGAVDVAGTNLCLVQTGDESLFWVGGELGLASAESKTGRTTPVPGFPGGPVRALLFTARSRLWCVGEDAIHEFDGRSWMPVRVGFDRVHGVTRGFDGSIWVAARNGLHRFLDGAWMQHGTAEGLPEGGVLQVMQTRRAEVWTATLRGAWRYVPSADQDPPRVEVVAPPGAGEVQTTDTVTLTLRGFDRWDYTPAGRLLYAYRLDEGAWSPYASLPQATLNNVPAGLHRLQVRVMDRNWNEPGEPAVFDVVSIVPWFREPRVVVVSLLGLLVAGFLASLAVNRHLRLVRSYAEVERMVAQRTRELERANEELVHSQKMRALGTLAAGIAHDFNSILSIIKGSAQIIEGNLDDQEKIRVRLGRIRTGVEQGSALVKAMLGFSRVTEKQRTACEVTRVMNDATHLVSDQFLGRVRLELQPAPGLPPVPGVAEMIQQMLLNFIINAVEALHGEGRIVLRSGLGDHTAADAVLAPARPGRHVWISVEDDGPGIPQENLQRIFEPFFTTKAMSTRRGTGLGLSMVYEMAKELGYGLAVESGVGRGTTFRILIPVDGA